MACVLAVPPLAPGVERSLLGLGCCPVSLLRGSPAGKSSPRRDTKNGMPWALCCFQVLIQRKEEKARGIAERRCNSISARQLSRKLRKYVHYYKLWSLSSRPYGETPIRCAIRSGCAQSTGGVWLSSLIEASTTSAILLKARATVLHTLS